MRHIRLGTGNLSNKMEGGILPDSRPRLDPANEEAALARLG